MSDKPEIVVHKSKGLTWEQVKAWSEGLPSDAVPHLPAIVLRLPKPLYEE